MDTECKANFDIVAAELNSKYLAAETTANTSSEDEQETIVENTDVYVVLHNNQPVAYSKSEDEGWDIINTNVSREVSVNSCMNYNLYVHNVSPFEINIVKSHRFYIVSYDCVFASYKLVAVPNKYSVQLLH